jgi:very-short-patch-repair endonuclease
MARKPPAELAQQFQRMRDTVRVRFEDPAHRNAYAERMRQRHSEASFKAALGHSIPRRSQSIKRAWDNASPEDRSARVRAASLGCGVHPNKQELRLDSIIQAAFPQAFCFNVSAHGVIAGKLPDFIHRSLPVVVELFGTYWHGPEKTGRSKEAEESMRSDHFSRHGYRLVVIWEHELDDAESVCCKIRQAVTSVMSPDQKSTDASNA